MSHDKAIEAALDTYGHAISAPLGKAGDIALMRRAIAAFLRSEAAGIEPSDTGPYAEYWRSIKEFLSNRADELEGK